MATSDPFLDFIHDRYNKLAVAFVPIFLAGKTNRSFMHIAAWMRNNTATAKLVSDGFKLLERHRVDVRECGT